jgi:hypothetical protein
MPRDVRLAIASNSLALHRRMNSRAGSNDDITIAPARQLAMKRDTQSFE